nr:hypothetical protein [Tanacetum cinerariifolium]
MIERCFTVLLNKLPSKEKDPGSFTIPCDIGNLHIDNAFADLGASIRLMPYTMYEKLGLGEPKPTRMSLELADRSIQYPRGIAENVLIKVDKFILPIDFVILDMREDSKIPIILGRPFLTTAMAMIDVFNKKITLRVGDDERITPEDKMYPKTQEMQGSERAQNEHLYSASANGIDEKKPELKELSPHLEYTYLKRDESWRVIISSKQTEKEKLYFCSKQDAKPRLTRWVLLLQGFNIKIKDKKRVENLAVDHLSRLENLNMGTLVEEEITDKFLDEHLMILKSKLNDEEPWYEDYNYFWDEPYAFRLCPDNVMRRCIVGNEILEILVHCHSGPTGGHHSASVTGRKVYEAGFYWPIIFRDAKDYVIKCDACPKSVNISSRNKMPQNNIQVCEVFDVWGLDFMGPFPDLRGNEYILVAVDYMSKWVEAQALFTNDACVVVKFLKGCLLDSGTAYKSPTRCTPFRMVYEKACHLPVEIEHKAYWALKQCNMNLTTAAKNRFMELNELIELRDRAYENTRIYKEKTKKWHDSRLRDDKDFKNKDKVLLFNSRLKLHSGKLKLIWTGPFVVKTMYPYRAIEITDKNGSSFKVNGHRLKKYHDKSFNIDDNEFIELDTLARKNELKARGTLLMALPDKHQLKFNIHKDAKNLMEAIEKRFGGNKETKKVQKTFLKQQYENFTGSSSESLDQIHDRLQKLISQLEILGEYLSQEDINLNAKNPVSAPPNVDTLSNAVIYSFFASQSNSSQLDNDGLKQIDADDLEEMALKWQMAMLTVRARRFLQRTGRNLRANGRTSMGFDMSKRLLHQIHWFHSVMVWAAMTGVFRQKKNQPTMPSWHSPLQVLPVLTMRLLVYQQNETVFEEDIKLLKLEVQLKDNALVVLRQKFKKAEQERDDLKLKLEKFQTSSKNLSQLLASQTNDKTGLGYNTQVFTSSMFDCDEMFTFETDESLPASPIYDRPSTPIIDDWVFDSEDDYEVEILQNITSFVQPTKQVKTPRPSVKTIETSIPAAKHKITIPKPKSHGTNRNRKACFVCKSLTHLIKDYDFYEKKMAQTQRGTHQQYARITLQNPQKHMVPTTVLTKSKLDPLTAARQVTTAVTPTNVTRPRPAKTVVTKHHSPPRKNINHSPSSKASTFPLKVTAAKAPMVNAVKDSGCSRHMTWNMSYLSDFEELNGRYVALVVIQRVICDKKNSVLFIDTKCIVLSPEFKLPDENQVLLTVLRENNMYNVDLKNIVPFRDFTCLFAKATLNESNLWHRRLSHINFKTMNKLIKGKFDGKADEGFLVGYSKPEFKGRKPKSEVYVSPSSSAQTKKHDDKTKREAKGKSPVESSTWYRNLSVEFEYLSDNSINEVNDVDSP